MLRLYSCIREVDFVCCNLSYDITDSEKPEYIHQEKKVQVKIDGDGAKFSHTSNFILFSFSFLGQLRMSFLLLKVPILCSHISTCSCVSRLLPRF